MKIPFQRVSDKPRMAYIENVREDGVFFPFPVPVLNYTKPAEDALIKQINEERGLGSKEVGAKIDEIAKIAAPMNGGDPLQVGGVLVQFRDRSPYVEDREKYLGLFAMYCPKEFQQFSDLVGENGSTRKMLEAARVHAMLLRIPEQENEFGKWNPLDWKTDDALNPEEISAGFVTAFSNFYLTENSGVSTKYLRTEIIEKKEILIYKWLTDEEIEEVKKTKDEIEELKKTDKKKALAAAGKS
jgi:hypothetical protein